MSDKYFKDRREAAEKLADKLKPYKDNGVVIGVTCGGVEIAVDIASKFHVPLDLSIVRKIGHPYDPDYPIGAVTASGPAVWNEAERLSPDTFLLEQAEASERAEAIRRRSVYLGNRKQVELNDKTVIIVDDGINTGMTIRAVVARVRKQRPSKVIVAVPVGPKEAIDLIQSEVDAVITIVDPNNFLGSVSDHYRELPDLTDYEIISLIDDINN